MLLILESIILSFWLVILGSPFLVEMRGKSTANKLLEMFMRMTNNKAIFVLF